MKITIYGLILTFFFVVSAARANQKPDLEILNVKQNSSTNLTVTVVSHNVPIKARTVVLRFGVSAAFNTPVFSFETIIKPKLPADTPTDVEVKLPASKNLNGKKFPILIDLGNKVEKMNENNNHTATMKGNVGTPLLNPTLDLSLRQALYLAGTQKYGTPTVPLKLKTSEAVNCDLNGTKTCAFKISVYVTLDSIQHADLKSYLQFNAAAFGAKGVNVTIKKGERTVAATEELRFAIGENTLNVVLNGSNSPKESDASNNSLSLKVIVEK